MPDDGSKMLSSFLISLGAAFSLFALKRYLRSHLSTHRSGLPYPPGPKGLPFIGNMLDIPRDLPIWEGFAQMSRKYQTGIMYLNMVGTDVVVLNSSEIIADLLDKRSAIYSDKPKSPIVELMGLNKWAFTTFGYGERWRKYRRLFYEFFNVATVDRYDEDQRKAVARLLANLSESPADFQSHIQLTTGSLALSITYNIQVDSPQNPYFHAVEKALEAIQAALVPGAFPVEFLPFLRHFPSWLPGGGARTYGDRVYRYSMDSIALPMQHVTERLKADDGIGPCLTTHCLDRLEVLREQGINELVIRDVAGLVYIGMADTTNAVLNTFFMAMARNTHVMKKAQKQLDRVTGGERLLDHSDVAELPYITAIIKELFRWSPPVPMGASHRLMEDDVYEGMFIPAGTVLFENIWGICWDEKAYPAPETFNPDRFLDEDGEIDPSVKDPEVRTFGSGRRVCPGRHFALRNLHLVISNVLAAFDILPPLDQDGNPQPPPPAFKYSQIRHPLPFKCIVNPRSEKALCLVKDLHARYWS